MDVIIFYLSDYSLQTKVLLASRCPLQAWTWAPLRTGKVTVRGPLYFFPFVKLGTGCVGFPVLSGVRREANGALLAPESLSHVWVISSCEDGDQLALIWSQPLGDFLNVVQ